LRCLCVCVSVRVIVFEVFVCLRECACDCGDESSQEEGDLNFQRRIDGVYNKGNTCATS
jgi:hypothetical protein